MLLDMEVDLGPGHIVLDGDPPKKGAQPPPIFGTCLLWPNGCMYQDTTWYGGRPQPRRHCVSLGTQPPFSVNVRYGQTAGWMKTPLGTEVDLGPGHIVLDTDPAASAKGAQQPPSFRSTMSIVATVAHLSYY